MKTIIRFFLAFLFLQSFFETSQLFALESSPQFIQGVDTLQVYRDIPGLTPSAKYAIRVRSAATNNEWVDCFANYTYNRAWELPNIPQNDGTFLNTVVQHYQKFTGGWSQTFCNFEMSKSSLVEVEISLINGFKVQGKDLTKVAAHPAHSVVSQPTIQDGKIYFTLNHPGQTVIDINGQMDDFNKAIDDKSSGQIYETHTIAIFSNPVLKKPISTGSRLKYIAVGTDSAAIRNISPATYDTLYFMPGIHNIGRNFKVYPGKKYYIPGDAIVYGSFNNYGVTSGIYRTNGDNIKVYGYGTISGSKITHPLYLPGNPDHTEFKTLTIENGMNVEINGITIIDPANHSVNFNTWGTRPDKMKEETFARWVKAISWRANGDGIGSAHLVEDCYLHTSDDASYIKGNRRRIVFWKDANAAMFHMAGIPTKGSSFPIIIEDCDVIYNRTRGVSGGGVFVQRAEGTAGQQIVDVTVRDFRVSDPRSNMPTFYFTSSQIESGIETIASSFSGLTFQNVTVAAPIVGGRKNEIKGHLQAPWYGGITFDNVTLAGKLLTATTFPTEFITNTYVKDIIFKNSTNYTLTINNPVNGSIISNPILLNYIDNTTVTLTAVPKSGYEFSGWSGDVSGIANPLDIVMNSNKTVSATFKKATSYTFQVPGSGSWIVPDGVIKVTLQVWGAGGAGGSAFCGLATTNTQVRGGGGAGGSYASVKMNVIPGQIINYTIGAGGVGAAVGFVNQSVGDSGGASYASFNNETIVSALGGTGGVNMSLTNQILSGTGGIAPTTGNIGNFVFYGGNGGNASSTGTGGGGGSAGAEGNGGSGGSPAAGVAGIVGGVAGAAGHNSSLPGNPGGVPGGGGSGAAVRNNSPFADNNAFKLGGKGGDGKIIILLDQNTDIKDITTNLDNGITVYPNPATDKLYFKANGYNVSKIQLVGLTGKIIFSSNDAFQTESIDLSGIPSGFYIVKAQTRDAIYSSKIMVK